VRLTNELKIWKRLSQGVLARGGDVPAESEVECLEIRTSSCYFHHAGICDVLAPFEVECLEIRTSCCYFQHTGVCDPAAASEVECLEI
jgi:hypothetical protein